MMLYFLTFQQCEKLCVGIRRKVECLTVPIQTDYLDLFIFGKSIRTRRKGVKSTQSQSVAERAISSITNAS